MQIKAILGNHTMLTEVATLKRTVVRVWEKWGHLLGGRDTENPAQHQNPFGRSSGS